MSLRSIVAALGGDLYDGGRRANIPAPGHSRADRSVSLLLDGDRLVIHSFGAADWREVREYLRGLGFAPVVADEAGGVGCPRRGDGARARLVASLWSQGTPLEPRCAASRYLRLRAVERSGAAIEELRFHSAVPVALFRPCGVARPALLAAIRAGDGRLTALEVTYLDQRGRRAEDLRLPRKTVGRLPGGSAVRLDAAAPAMLVAEGVVSALSASERFGLPAWALLSTSNLRRWVPPPEVRRVLIAADRGPDGERSARLLAGRLWGLGVEVAVRWPPLPHGDWNDAMRARRVEAGRGGAPVSAQEGSWAHWAGDDR